jgi:hypothetical protein
MSCASWCEKIKEGRRKFGPEQPAKSGRPVSAIHNLNSQKVDQLITANELRGLCKDPQEVETRINHVCWRGGGGGPMLLQRNARPHVSAATSAAIENIRFEVVLHPPYGLNLAPSDFWFFAALTKHLKGINFTCDEQF